MKFDMGRIRELSGIPYDPSRAISEDVDVAEKLEEEQEWVPPGYKPKRVSSKVKKVSYASHNGGLSFHVASKIYDTYLKDQIGAVEPGIEKSTEWLRKAGYSEGEIQSIFDEARGGERFFGISLPKPITIRFTVFEYS